MSMSVIGNGKELMRKAIFQQLTTIRGEMDELTRLLLDNLTDTLEPSQAPEACNEPEPKEPEAYYDAHALAETLGVSTSTIYRWVREGRFPTGESWGPRTKRWSSAVLRKE